MNQSDVEIKTVLKENAEKIDGIGNIPVPDMNEAFARFENKLREEELSFRSKKIKKSFKTGVKLTAIAAAACILLVLSSVVNSYLVRKPDVSSINPMQKVATLEEAQQKAGFSMVQPSYMPEGYALEGIYIIRPDDTITNVRQSFVRKDTYIYIDKTLMKTNEEDVNFEGFAFEKVRINGRDIDYVTDGTGFTGMLWNEENFKYYVTSPQGIPKDELTKIVSNLGEVAVQ